MNVLSLFDGMSCAQIALERAGIPVTNYYAAEIDKYAITVTQANYPNTIQLGDIKKIKGVDLPKIDIIIGGSPCQGFSYAGKQLNFNDPRSALFFEFVRLLKECSPKFFILENVKMKKTYQDVISEVLGVRPIEINSALVSAQNRKRLYWTNIPNVKQPKDKNIFLKDILHTGIPFSCSSSGRGCGVVEYRKSDIKKAHTLTATGYSNRSFTVVSGIIPEYNLIPNYKTLLKSEFIRKLTPIECERLQTVPDNYTNYVSDSQRYKMLGNGFTVDIIVHILKQLFMNHEK